MRHRSKGWEVAEDLPIVAAHWDHRVKPPKVVAWLKDGSTVYPAVRQIPAYFEVTHTVQRVGRDAEGNEVVLTQMYPVEGGSDED